MSEGKVEQKYFEKLNISVLSISKVKELIKNDIKNTINAWNKGKNVDKQCFRLIGDAGIGKTQICFQIAKELTSELNKTFNIIMVKAPVLSRDDFIIPFPVVGNTNSDFQMLYSDFVPRGEDTYGLFVIDEFSRGDHSLQQLLWQVQNEYRIHRKKFPKGWFVISVDNPDDQEYQLDSMEDAAGLRRQLHLYVEVNPMDFLKYAIENEFHKYVVSFIQSHPDYLYDYQSQKIGAVYANPASWEKVSDHLWKFELNGGVLKHLKEIEYLASGLLNTNKTRMFIEHITEQKDINPRDIFYSYSKVENQIKEYVKLGNNAKLGELMTGFVTFMISSMPEYETISKFNLSKSSITPEMENVVKFLTTVSIDTAALFITNIDALDQKDKSFLYMTKLHTILISKSFTYKKDFYDKILEISSEE